MPSRGVRVFAFVALLLAATFATVPTALAVPILMGGQLYYTGGDVTVDVVYSNTAYGEVLQLRSALEVLDIARNKDVGSRITLTEQQFASWGIGVGDELTFGLQVPSTNQVFLMGPGSRNGDGLEHAYVSGQRAGTYYVGLEDLFGGGDRDYNDTIFRLSGGVASAPRAVARYSPTASTVAEPSSLLLLLTGGGLLGFVRRRNQG